jgi:glycosyltransferase involved in cell wall biosynthesis
MVRSADAVVAGNAYLKDQATLWTSPDRVHVIPTYLEPGRYPLAVHKRCTSVQLVWIGSASTLPALEQIRPALEQLAQRRPDLRLKIVCDRFLEFDNLVIHRCPWSEHREVHDLADADIGISWVPDDAWSRGKCGLKILQYMAAGLPVVANPVGMQAKLVRHGETGYLARTADEWQIAIDSLADNPELRRRMGLAGRAFVERYYDLREGATRWLTLLDHLRGDKHSLPTTTRRQM